MPKLLLATENHGKQVELLALLSDLPFQFETPETLDLHLNISEDGSTYAENAVVKALAYARVSQLASMADDSGLEVDALDGKPGVHSARFVPWSPVTDADRRRYLLGLLAGKPRPWTAHFHSTVVIALPDGRLFYFDGRCEGEIIPDERGSNGFGYDPIFLIPTLGLTMAELSTGEKNRLSHRARAVLVAKPNLIDILE